MAATRSWVYFGGRGVESLAGVMCGRTYIYIYIFCCQYADIRIPSKLLSRNQVLPIFFLVQAVQHWVLLQNAGCVDCSVLGSRQEVQQAALADVIAVRERDPACTAYSSALLYYKGYHALQTHRIAHGLWERGQTVLARSLQVHRPPPPPAFLTVPPLALPAP